MECEIARVFHDAHHFNEFSAGARCAAEALADRIFVLEKLARKSLIDNCYFSRTWPILRGDAAPFDLGVPMTSKYPAVTRSQEAKKSSAGPGGGWPSTQTAAPQAPPIWGVYRQSAVDDTPGTFAMESWMRR